MTEQVVRPCVSWLIHSQISLLVLNLGQISEKEEIFPVPVPIFAP